MRKKRNDVEVRILFKKIKYSTEEVVSMVRRTFELPFDVEVTPVTETFECKENFPDKEIKEIKKLLCELKEEEKEREK